jgi:putative peptide zinc metalloprotease protein
MSGPFHSDRWYRVAQLVPSLRAQVRIHRHKYRGDTAYVLQDSASNRMLRVTHASARIFGLMDGRRTLDSIWQVLVADPSCPPPRQDEVIDLVSRAHGFDLVQADLPPEISALAERRYKEKKRKLRGQIFNPLSIKLPLWDPDRFLSGTLRFARPAFGWAGLGIWLAAVLFAIVQAGTHWSDLTNNVHDRLLSLGNLALISMIYPVVKALHELGHGYAVKVHGGNVHEMGVMLIYLMPVPYVEASAANAYADKWQRVTVSAAGIIVETFLASMAMLVWLAVEPGIVRTIAFNVMVICGVSTVVFNGNPLMRYDGYFMLADMLEMPNLAQRSATFWTQWIQSTFFGLEPANAPPRDPRERLWLWFYQMASLPYRLFVAVAIGLWLASDFFFVGVLLALAMCWSTFIRPLWKGLLFLLVDGRLVGRRFRALGWTACVASGIAALLVFVPVTLHRSVEGVVWIPEDAQIRAGEDAFVEHVPGEPSSVVRAGDAIIVARNSELAARANRMDARVRELQVEFARKQFTDRPAAAVTREALQAATSELERLRERQSRLVWRAGVSGRLSMAQADDLAGRYVKKGELLGYVLDNRPRVVRVVVEQDDIELVRSRMLSARLVLAGAAGDPRETHMVREVPAGQNEIPMPSLGISGGGRIAEDPRDQNKSRSLNRIFQFDFQLPSGMADVPMGTRVYLRLALKPEPMWDHMSRRLRQLLLTRLSV